MLIAPELAGIALMGVLPAPVQDAEHVVGMGDVLADERAHAGYQAEDRR